MSSNKWGNWNLPMFHIEGWISDPDIHGLLDGSCDVVHLPTYHREVVHTCVMTCCTGMVIDEGKGPKMFHEAFLKGPYRFTYVFLITSEFITFIPVDYSAFVCYIVLVLGGHQ